MADEHARLNGDPRWVRGQAFPYEDDLDDAIVAGMLGELADAGVVVAYEADGDPYLFLPKLARHQRLEPGKVASKIPAPPEQQEQPHANESAPRADSSEPDAGPSALLYGAGSMEHVAGSRGAARRPDRAEPEPRQPRPPDASGLHEIPDDFKPTDAMRRWANSTYPGLDLDEETAQFCRYWRSEGRRKKSWADAWQKWIADSHKRMAQSARASPQQKNPDEQLAAALRRIESREERTGDPHGNGIARPLHQVSLPPAAN